MKYLRKIQIPKPASKSVILVLVGSGLILINAIVFFAFILPAMNPGRGSSPITPEAIGAVEMAPVEATSTLLPPTAIPPQNDLPDLLNGSSVRQGMIVFSMIEEGYSHLFAFSPGDPTLMRLTANPWDDTSPAIHPDGTKIAYSSRRNGYWDIYILDLLTGSISAVTDTPEFDSSPSWSPDGSRIVFQSYIAENMEIVVADLREDPVKILQVTFNKMEDYDPDWSPYEDRIVFVSSEGGRPSLWSAALEDTVIQVRPIKVDSGEDPRHPVWGPDGKTLSWSARAENRRTLFTWNSKELLTSPLPVVEGDLPTWSPDGAVLFSSIPQPNQDYLAAYSIPYGNLVYPVTPTQGKITGIDWMPTVLPSPIPEWIHTLQQKAIPALYRIEITPPPENLPNRYQLIPVNNLKAPYPVLHDMVNESFQTLRERLKVETGWDVLANLEQAYIPLSDVSGPDLEENWLYTGRAFGMNYIPMNVDWMFITREDHGNQTYFHVYIRPLYRDGSMGTPVTSRAWNINARFDNNPSSYEHGGELMATYPTGYWVDVTDIALRYGWERLPATPNWMTYFQGARFNQFALRHGLNWRDAMLELYPREIFITPTAEVAPTQTPTPTQRLLKTKTPSLTPTLTVTPTRRPTWTPIAE